VIRTRRWRAAEEEKLMNVAVIRGRLSRDPETRDLPSGDRVVNYEVTVRDVTPAESVPVVWFEPTGGWADLIAGDEVVVTGRVRRRFFRTASGTASRTEVVAERVLPVRQVKRVRAALDKASTVIDAGSA
jgi:single-strand DNA-binding protein